MNDYIIEKFMGGLILLFIVIVIVSTILK